MMSREKMEGKKRRYMLLQNDRKRALPQTADFNKLLHKWFAYRSFLIPRKL